MRGACLIAVLAPLAPAAHAPASGGDRDCSQRLEKKGLSTDYVKPRTGKRQRGMAESWRGNVETKDAQAGDVVITHIPDKGRRMRAS